LIGGLHRAIIANTGVDEPWLAWLRYGTGLVAHGLRHPCSVLWAGQWNGVAYRPGGAVGTLIPADFREYGYVSFFAKFMTMPRFTADVGFPYDRGRLQILVRKAPSRCRCLHCNPPIFVTTLICI